CGAPTLPARQNTGRTATRVTCGPGARTKTSARPGTTIGGRTMTRISYGPAFPAKKTFGLPTCADATTARTPARPARPNAFIAAPWSSSAPTPTQVRSRRRRCRTRRRAARRAATSRRGAPRIGGRWKQVDDPHEHEHHAHGRRSGGGRRPAQLDRPRQRHEAEWKDARHDRVERAAVLQDAIAELRQKDGVVHEKQSADGSQ